MTPRTRPPPTRTTAPPRTRRPPTRTATTAGPEPGAVRLRIDLAYDGSGFAGFARQPGQRTVQGVLEAALERLLGAKVATTGAGRTDRGVHADAQTVHADVPAGARLAADPAALRAALAALAGPEMAVLRVRRVPATFDARFSARARAYRYRLCDALALPPRWRHDTWHVPRRAARGAGSLPRDAGAGSAAGLLDVAAMTAAGAHLLGEHDFASFCRRADGGHTVRRIDRLAVSRRGRGLVVIDIEGPAFCHQLVRSVVGTLVEVGRGRRQPGWVADALAARDRAAAGPVAPPHGLTLTAVRYGTQGG